MSGGPDACWPWTGHRIATGYGQVRVRGKATTASRVALELSEGRPLEADEQACHRCDNPPCCNPAHLFRGSHVENMQDKEKKGRHGYGGMPGERHHQAKLTEHDVREIRRRCEAGERHTAIAASYGVTGSLIGMIRKRQIWKHLLD